MNKLIWVTQIIAIPLLLSSAFFLYSKKETKEIVEKQYVNFELSNKSLLDVEIEEINRVQKVTPTNILIGGWIPDWDIPDGVSSMQSQNLNYISPVWFYPNEDGSLKETSRTNDQDLFNEVSRTGIRLIPAISQFDTDTLSKVLNSKEATQRHIEAIVDMVVRFNYDGIDLDYESTYLKDKKSLFDLVKNLSERLKSLGKVISFTVLPKWGNNVTYFSLPQTRRVQDYLEIAKYVDEVRIMTYDYYGSSSDIAGPVGPIDWIETVIKYAIKEGVPREKLFLGIATYSYDWTEREIAPDKIDFFNWTGNLGDSEKERGVALFNGGINVIKAGYNLEISYNDNWEEAVGRYTYGSSPQIVVFPTQRSFDARKELAASYGLKGVAYWRIGDEGELKF